MCTRANKRSIIMLFEHLSAYLSAEKLPYATATMFSWGGSEHADQRESERVRTPPARLNIVG